MGSELGYDDDDDDDMMITAVLLPAVVSILHC
jgi:hypothetical protein